MHKLPSSKFFYLLFNYCSVLLFFRLLKYHLNVFLCCKYTVLHLPFNTTCKDFHFSAQILAMLNNVFKQYYVHLLHGLLCIQYSTLVTDPGLTSKPLCISKQGEKKIKSYCQAPKKMTRFLVNTFILYPWRAFQES